MCHNCVKVYICFHQRLLIWTDWGSQDKIEVATLAGENRRPLVETNLVDPSGLTIDYTSER